MGNWKCPKCGREFKRVEQSHYCGKPTTVDEYIAAQEESVRPKLQELRTILRTAIPEAEERISWGMPTYWKRHNIIHFAAGKRHIGIYPGPDAVIEFAERLQGYKTSKGAIQLPNDRELPLALVADIGRWSFEKITGASIEKKQR